MKKQIDDVEKFHETFSHPINKTPQFPDEETQKLRESLIQEELEEFKEANADGDIVEVMDALTDLLYVTYGAMICYGLGEIAEECFQEVQNSNMSKADADGNPIVREDGKILKGENYFKPDIKSIVEKHLDN